MAYTTPQEKIPQRINHQLQLQKCCFYLTLINEVTLSFLYSILFGRERSLK